MTVEQLACLATDNRWANAHLLQMRQLSLPPELKRDLEAGTLIHLLWGERGWLRFWQVGEFVQKPRSEDYPEKALEEAWREHQERYERFLHGLTQTDLDGLRTRDGTIYTLGELVQRSLNPSTYHRGQIALQMRQLGYPPPFTDYHDFLAQARSQLI
jgi:uncharacterized damage-inducible protein DinB